MAKDESLEAVLSELTDAVGDLGDLNKKEVDLSTVDLSSFPTEMSCTQVFDQLLKCYSVGGQFRHYYRYGEIAMCEDKRDKMKFCLGTKLKDDENRKKAVIQWYMRQLAEQKVKGRSSEQIWSARAEPLRRPFREDSAAVFENGQN